MYLTRLVRGCGGAFRCGVQLGAIPNESWPFLLLYTLEEMKGGSPKYISGQPPALGEKRVFIDIALPHTYS